MSRLLEIIKEREDVKVFDALTRVFSYYVEKYPGTAVEMIYSALLDHGIKCLPKDKAALSILTYLLNRQLPDASKVGEIMNLSFEMLPEGVRPVFAAASQKETACWMRDDKVYSKVMSLINLDDASDGRWSSRSGELVQLLNK